MDNDTDVLIVEDSPTQAEHLKYILEQHEYRVCSARNGREALVALQARRPRVVISDVIMPEMDGFELCRRIRADQAFHDLPFIVLTTLADPKDVIRALECGATNFISKPYDEQHLISRIRHVLANYELRQNTRMEMGVTVFFAGEQHYITAERLQILDLLLTTYETAVRENAELARVRDELQRLNESLEQTVEEKTAALTREIAIALALQQVRNEVLQIRDEADWEKVVAAFEANLRRLVTFNACSINLVDETSGTATLYYTLPERLGSRVTTYLAPALRLALDTGRPVYRRNLTEVRESDDEVGQWDQTVQAIVDVPFAGGTIAINSLEEDPFSEQDIQVLEQFAQVAAEACRRLDDLKALTESEARFRQAQKLESLGRLAGGVAHDFNNLLTIITGNTQLLLRHSGLKPALGEGLREIQDAGQRAVALVRQLLVFSRRQVLQRQVLNLNQLLTDVGRMLRRVIGEDVELVMALEPGLGQVEADPSQMEQVLMNLAVNARDAMPQGGKLVLETKNVELDGHYLAAHAMQEKTGPYVLLSVSDTGSGMSAEVQAQIFEPFFTTKEAGKGTGLGLATVYGVVKQSGGAISVYSEVGQGTTFKIYLPRVGIEHDRPAAPETTAAESQWQGDEVLLVAEDDEGVRSLAVRSLQAQGYMVLEAANGVEALELLRQQGATVRLLLTDVIMPGMLGRELAEQVGRLYPQIRVMFMSGYSEHTALPRELQADADRFIQKPFTPDALAHRVRQILG